jgi:hypothetical protein
MRTFQIGVIFLFVGLIGYAYFKNPEGCRKLADDFIALFHPPPPAPAEPPKAPPASPPPPKITENAPSPAPVTPPAPALPVSVTPSPLAIWKPPAVLPSQPNWTWTTSSGKTYENVVVTTIKPDSVSITHSTGMATIDISTLPQDIQKQLNYDPVAAMAAQAESDRELNHPYFLISRQSDAQNLARQLHWPLAWICSDLNALNAVNPKTGSAEDLTQMALNFLKSRAVIIFLNGNDDLPALSPIIRDQQLFQMDDGPLPDGHHFYAPKIVFSDANITKAFGRVSYTQMTATREVALDAVLQVIATDPSDQALLNGQPAGAPAMPEATPTPPGGAPATPATIPPTPTNTLAAPVATPTAPPSAQQ